MAKGHKVQEDVPQVEVEDEVVVVQPSEEETVIGLLTASGYRHIEPRVVPDGSTVYDVYLVGKLDVVGATIEDLKNMV